MNNRHSGRYSLPNRPYDSRAGFTLLETLVTLVLVSLLTLVLSAGVIGSQRLMGAATGTAASATRILQLDRYLRRSVGRIVIPYWVGPLKIDDETLPLELPYVDGEQELTLVLESQEGRIGVRTPEDSDGRWFGPFAAVSVQPVMRGGALAGVRVAIETDRTGRIVTIEAAIGSNPIPEAP